MGQMTECNVKDVTRRVELAENHHPTLQFPAGLRSVLVSFSSLFCFGFIYPQIYCFDAHQHCFQKQSLDTSCPATAVRQS